MKPINPYLLGASLFVPANHKNLSAIVTKKRYPALRSLVIDLEDGLDDSKLEEALKSLEEILKGGEKSLFVFVRPRNVEILEQILSFSHVKMVDGFVLPKFSLKNSKNYLTLLKDQPFSFMPSIEGEELFLHLKLEALKEILLPFKEQIPLIRFGLEDMLRQLGMRRSCERSIFDYSAPSAVLGNFLGVFKSAGFMVSGGVYPCFKDPEGFKKDILRDLEEGLFSKTIVHPSQIELCEELYKVSKQHYQEAQELLKAKKAVFAQDGKMAETSTMRGWAAGVVQRGEIYGLN